MMQSFPNTQTEQFWHPVMGAVDLITQDVIRKREQKRLEEKESAALERETQGKQWSGMLDLIGSQMNRQDIDPKDRSNMFKAMQSAIQRGPGAAVPTVQPPQQMMRPLRDDVRKAFSTYQIPGFDPNGAFPWDKADDLEKRYDEALRAKGYAKRQESGVTSTVRHISSKDLTQPEIDSMKWKRLEQTWRDQRRTAETNLRNATAALKLNPQDETALDAYDRAQQFMTESDRALNEISRGIDPGSPLASLQVYGDTKKEDDGSNEAIQSLLDQMKKITEKAQEF